MNDIYEFFEGNRWLNILFLILAIVGIYLTFIFYYKSLKNKVPVYNVKTTRLIDSNISTIQNIEIKYKGNLLENLSLSKLSFWNSGKEPIRKVDIASANPLLISTLENIIIYDFEIIYQNTVNKIEIVKNDEGKLEISFDFLDYNDGIVLNIYHSGKSNKDLKISGTLIGSKKISYGINEEFFLTKLNKIFTPADYMANHKFWVIRSLGNIIAIPLIMFAFPFVLIFGPIDYLTDKISKRKIPKNFYIE